MASAASGATLTIHPPSQNAYYSNLTQRIHTLSLAAPCTASYQIQSSWSGSGVGVTYEKSCENALAQFLLMKTSGEDSEYHVKDLMVCQLGSENTKYCEFMGSGMSVNHAIRTLNSQMES